MRKNLYVTPALLEDLTQLTHAMLDERGREVLNPAPVANHVEQGESDSLQNRIRRILHRELGRFAQAQGHETFEEANDLDVPEEDPEPMTTYQQMGGDIPVMKDEVIPSPAETPTTPEATEAGSQPVNSEVSS